MGGRIIEISDVDILHLAADLPSVGRALERRGMPKRLVQRKLEKLVDSGLLDFGASIWCAWPTRAGLQRLRESAK